MELLNIEECHVTVKLDNIACQEVSRRLKAADHDGDDYLAATLAMFFESAGMAAGVYSEMDQEYRARYPFAHHRAKRPLAA